MHLSARTNSVAGHFYCYRCSMISVLVVSSYILVWKHLLLVGAERQGRTIQSLITTGQAL